MIKGALIRDFIQWYADRYGDERVRQMTRDLPTDIAHLVDPEAPASRLLASSWYPARLVHAMLDGLLRTHDAADVERMAKEACRALVRQASTGVYRFLLQSIVTPELYAMSVPRLWRQLHSTGRRRVELIGKNEARSTVSAWSGHHPMLCSITISTMAAVFEAMGCQEVRWERVECVSRGGRQCVTLLRWRS